MIYNKPITEWDIVKIDEDAESIFRAKKDPLLNPYFEHAFQSGSVVEIERGRLDRRCIGTYSALLSYEENTLRQFTLDDIPRKTWILETHVDGILQHVEVDYASTVGTRYQESQFLERALMSNDNKEELRLANKIFMFNGTDSRKLLNELEKIIKERE